MNSWVMTARTMEARPAISARSLFHPVEQWFSPFQMLRIFSTGPHIVMTPSLKVIYIAT